MGLWIIVFALCLIMLIYSVDKSRKIKNNALIGAYKISYFPQQKIMLIIMLSILTLLSGLRFETGGTDYFVYEKVYKSLPSLKLFFTNFRVLDTRYTTYGHEKGWLFLMSLSKTIGLNYNAFLFCHSLFFFYCLYNFIKKYNIYPILTLMLFMYMLYFYNTMVSLRQSTTLGMFFLMLPYLKKRKFVKYMLLTALAFTFHRAAIILVFPYFIYAFKPNKKFLEILFFSSIPLLILSLLNINFLNIFTFLSPLIKNLFGATAALKFLNIISGSGESISILHSLQYLAVLFLTIVFYDDFMKADRSNIKMAIVMLICLYPILIILRNYAILTRIKDYFVLFYGIILGWMCYIKNGKYLKYVLPICIMLCSYGYFRYIINFDNGHFTRYQTIIDFIFKSKKE